MGLALPADDPAFRLARVQYVAQSADSCGLAIYGVQTLDVEYPQELGVQDLTVTQRLSRTFYAAARGTLSLRKNDVVLIAPHNGRWWIIKYLAAGCADSTSSGSPLPSRSPRPGGSPSPGTIYCPDCNAFAGCYPASTYSVDFDASTVGGNYFVNCGVAFGEECGGGCEDLSGAWTMTRTGPCTWLNSVNIGTYVRYFSMGLVNNCMVLQVGLGLFCRGYLWSLCGYYRNCDSVNVLGETVLTRIGDFAPPIVGCECQNACQLPDSITVYAD